MKKTEMIDQEKGKKSRKLILILALLGIALALLAIIGLIKFGTVFFFIPFWFWTVDKIIELTGANLWLARGFAALFVLPFFYLIKLIFSWKAERRLVGWILFSLLTASLCFTMFFLSEDIYFSFKTGQAEKWYIVTPTGEFQFSASPGYNTFWGLQYQQVTPEVIRKYVEQERAGKATKTTGNKETKNFSLSSEEEKFLVKELKKISLPGSSEEENRLFDIVELFEKSGSLSKNEDLLCAIVKKNLVREDTYGRLYGHNGQVIAEKAIDYLARVGSEKSIPTLMWALVNIYGSPDRGMVEETIKTIKEREGKATEKPTNKEKEKEIALIAPEKTTPKEDISEKTTEKTVSGEEKVTEKSVADREKRKEAIPKETTPEEIISTKMIEEIIPKKATNKYEGFLENKMDSPRNVQIVKVRTIFSVGDFGSKEKIVTSRMFKGGESVIMKLPEGCYAIIWYNGNCQVQEDHFRIPPPPPCPSLLYTGGMSYRGNQAFYFISCCRG